MTTNRTFLIVILLTLIGLAIGLGAYPQLPERVPSDWNSAGEVDDTMGRTTAVFLIPGRILVLGVVLLYLPNIDPLRANVERFRSTYNGFIVGLSAYFLFVHVLIILAGLGLEFNTVTLVIPAASLLIFGIGLVLERTRPNWFLGIRTPWTLSSPAVWDKTHRLGGRLFKLSAGATLLGLLFSPEVAFFVLLGSILIAALVSVVYSYLAYRAETDRQDRFPPR